MGRDRTGRGAAGQPEQNADTPAMTTLAKPPLWIRLALRSPRRRRIAEVSDLWMFSRTMAAMLGANVDVVTALSEVAFMAQAKSPALAAAVQGTREGVRNGRLVSESMADHQGVFPPMLVEMAKAGERMGWLSGTFAKAADFYGRELDHLNRIPCHCDHDIDAPATAAALESA